MTSRWHRAAEAEHRGGDDDELDPVAAGRRYDLAPHVSIEIWDRVCLEADDEYGRVDDRQARRRFHEVAARTAAAGGRLRPDPGKSTVVSAADKRSRSSPIGDRAPGKVTRVEAEARRRGRRPQALVPTSAPVELPHRVLMEQLLGRSFGDVTAHVGEAPALSPFGARGAAWSETVVFASADPEPSIVAHELAHVEQLRRAGGAAHAPGRPWSVSWDASEIEADQVAHVVARGGRPARPSAPPTGAISFDQPSLPPPPLPAPELGGLVRASLVSATDSSVPFADAVADLPGYRHNVRRAMDPTVADFDLDLVRGIEQGARRIGALQLTVEMAGQPGPTAITFDRLLVLLGETFVGGELAEYGLPSSFGVGVALDAAAGTIEDSFITGVYAAVEALHTKGATDETRRALPGIVANSISTYLPEIKAALEEMARSWNDPMDLLELELQGAISALEALREDLADGSTTAGPAISRLARYILLLSDHLGSIQDRVDRQKKRGQSISVLDEQGGKGTELARAEIAMRDARETAGGEDGERQTIRRLESKRERPELLGQQLAFATTVDGGLVPTAVQPEEAFPAATDDFVLQAQSDLAHRMLTQRDELERMRATLAPDAREMHGYAEFKEVYARWFSFFSRAERDDNGGYQLFSKLMALAPRFGEMGWRGWVVSATAMYASQSIPLPATNTTFLGSESGMGALRPQRSQQVSGGAEGATYGFAQVHGDHRGTGETAESGSRSDALDGGHRNRTRFAAVYGAGGDDEPDKRTKAAFDQHLVTEDPNDPTAVVMTGHKSGFDDDRYGAGNHWNYFLRTKVGDASKKLQTVYEHKVMRDEVAEYLLALSQHHETLDRHHARGRGVAIGDRTARSEGLEKSRVAASATYDDPASIHRQAQSQGYRDTIEAAREAARSGPLAGPSLQVEADRLVDSLEVSLDGFFSTASQPDRLHAILRIAADEYDLEEAIWDQLEPGALWEVAKEAVEVALLMAAVSRLGRIGQKIADKVQGHFRRQGRDGAASLLIQFAVWFQKAIVIDTFDAARHWAMPVPSFASTIAAILADRVVDAAGGAISRTWTPRSPDPRTVGEMRAELEPHLADPASRADLAAELEATLRTELDARTQATQAGLDPPPLTPEQQELWVWFHVVDPAAARRLGGDLDLPPLSDANPMAVTGTVAPRDTLLVNEPRRLEVKNEITLALDEMKAIPGPSRVEVLELGAFEAKFRTQKGKAAVVVADDGVITVYVRTDATSADVREEAIHLAQYASSVEMAENIHMLSEASLGEWDRMDAGTRRDLFLRKLDLELDAKVRELDDDTNPDKGIDAAQYTQLAELKREAGAFSEDQLRIMDADPSKAPDYLRDPSWLFKKELTVKGKVRTSIDPDLGKLPATSVADSPWNRRAEVANVVRRGEPWSETTTVRATSTGKVTVKRLADKSGWVVSVGGRRHVTEARPMVDTGDDLAPGRLIAIERSRQFRVVEARLTDGTIERRVEQEGRDGWVKWGGDSNLRGKIAEIASQRDIDAELAEQRSLPADQREDGYEEYQSALRIEHQNRSGQGFDDVVIEFHGTGADTRAVIRIVEVKDFPNRGVPLEKMTAIRAQNLDANIKALEHALRERARKLPKHRRRALEKAMKDRRYRVEIRLGPTTRMGDEAAGSHTVQATLRQELMDYFGDDVLAAEPVGIDRDTIEDVVDGMKTDPGDDG